MSWLTTTFTGKMVMVFFASMVPVTELRGAIPIGVGMGLPLLPTIGICILGNMVPVPFIIFFIEKIFAWMRTRSEKLDRLVTRMEQKALNKQDIIDRYKALGLYILVAIPLPGTGAWTGSLVAALFEFEPKKAVPIIFGGVITAGVIIGIITGGVSSLF